jgi:bifunctional non-homologous end joining protein LigD
VLTFIEPMVPSLVQEPPQGGEWLHEIKYDGYRTQIVIDGEAARAFTRRGYDWSDRYESLLEAARDLGCSSAILDGEAIVQDAQGRSDFDSFATALQDRPLDIILMAFDLVHLNGLDLRKTPLLERRAALADLVGCHDPSCRIQFSEHVAQGHSLFEAADRMGLEGIVSKRATSRYRSGSTKSWLKSKCVATAEFIVIGTQPAQNGPACALLAREAPEGLSYAGSAFVTLSGTERELFWRQMERLRRSTPSLPISRTPSATWVEPRVRVRARFLKGSDKLRHATLVGLLSSGGMASH